LALAQANRALAKVRASQAQVVGQMTQRKNVRCGQISIDAMGPESKKI